MSGTGAACTEYPSDRPVVVLGLGNTLLSDEGIGVHVVRYLRARLPMDAVQYIDGGTLSFTLAGSIESAARLIVVDASELRAAPGTVRCFRDAAMEEFLGRNRKRSVHEISLLDLLGIAHLVGRLPTRRALIGIQPASVAWGDCPTEPVAGAIPRVAELVRELIREWRQ